MFLRRHFPGHHRRRRGTRLDLEFASGWFVLLRVLEVLVAAFEKIYIIIITVSALFSLAGPLWSDGTHFGWANP